MLGQNRHPPKPLWRPLAELFVLRGQARLAAAGGGAQKQGRTLAQTSRWPYGWSPGFQRPTTSWCGVPCWRTWLVRTLSSTKRYRAADASVHVIPRGAAAEILGLHAQAIKDLSSAIDSRQHPRLSPSSSPRDGLTAWLPAGLLSLAVPAQPGSDRGDAGRRRPGRHRTAGAGDVSVGHRHRQYLVGWPAPDSLPEISRCSAAVLWLLLHQIRGIETQSCRRCTQSCRENWAH